MKDAADLPVRVSSAGFEFDRRRRRRLLFIVRVEPGSTELEPVDKQPYSVPAHWLQATAPQELVEFLHCVGSALHSQHPDLGSGIKRRKSVAPPPFQSRAHRPRFGVPGHDRDDPARSSAAAELVNHRLRLIEVPKHPMTQHRGEARYDANGNLVSRGSDTFGYDWASRMTAASVSGVSTSYSYDGDGVRTSKTVGGGTQVTYLWDRESGLALLVDDGSSGYLQAGGPVEDIDTAGAPQYHLNDALRSTRALTDQTGSVTGTLDYDVFGASRAASGATSGLTFAGEQSDAETGFTYLRARYLDPSVGRFTAVDNVQPNAPATQGFNLYAYVANNPVTWTDPSGHLAPDPAPKVDAIPILVAACLRTTWCAQPLLWYLALPESGLVGVAAFAGITFILIACALDVVLVTVSDSDGVTGSCFWTFKKLYDTVTKNAPTTDPRTDPRPPSPTPPGGTRPPRPNQCDGLNLSPSQLLLLYIPEGRPGGRGYGLRHIQSEHSFSTEPPDGKNSRFKDGGTTRPALESLLKTAMTNRGSATWTPTGANCTITVFVGDVGTDADGHHADWVTISVNPNTLGVTTMFPSSHP